MPELCRFYNIVIKMIFMDDEGELLAGSLPVKQLRLVQAWAAIHEDELYKAWNNAVRGEELGKIEPLK